MINNDDKLSVCQTLDNCWFFNLTKQNMCQEIFQTYNRGIAKLLVADCETLAKVGLCCHFDSVIRPEAERIGAGVAV